MLVSFFIAAGLVLAVVILRAYSSGEDHARYLAKAELARFQDDMPGEPIAQLSEDDFIRYFEWLRKRRFWIFMAGFVAMAVPATIFVMSVLGFVKLKMDPGPWMWGFLAIFVLVGTWTGSAAATLYLYRVKRDASLMRNLKTWKKSN